MQDLSNLEHFLLYVKAFTISTKYERVPFDPTLVYIIITKLYELSAYYSSLPDLHNIFYLLIEEQSRENNFIITPSVKRIIYNYREKVVNKLILGLEYHIIKLAKKYRRILKI